MMTVKVTFNKISVTKILAVLLSCTLVSSRPNNDSVSQRLLRRAKRSNCISSSESEILNYSFPKNLSISKLQCKPGCNEIKVEVKYAVIKFKTVVVGCRETPFPSNAERAFNNGQGFEWQCKKGYNPVMEYPTTVEYEGDDKLVLKKGKGVLLGCEKAS